MGYCKGCGAPLEGNTCKYCGTFLKKRAKQKVKKETYCENCKYCLPTIKETSPFSESYFYKDVHNPSCYHFKNRNIKINKNWKKKGKESEILLCSIVNKNNDCEYYESKLFTDNFLFNLSSILIFISIPIGILVGNIFDGIVGFLTFLGISFFPIFYVKDR